MARYNAEGDDGAKSAVACVHETRVSRRGTVSKRLGVWVRPILLACLTWAGSVSGASYQVTLDTSSLNGQAKIAFDLIDGGSPLNSITLSGFTPSVAFSSPSATGDVTGTL